MKEQPQQRLVLDRSTGISIGVVVVLIGVAVWLTNVNATAVSNGYRITKVERKGDATNAALIEISKSMAVFAEKLKHVDIRRK